MSDYDPTSHPLHGLGLHALISELVEHYDWPILAEQVPLNCFKSNPSVKSSVKFLHKTRWARERLEAFYLYKYKQCPLPSDEQFELAPRNRSINGDVASSPAKIELGEREFFDDPASGPVLPSKAQVQGTRRQPAERLRDAAEEKADKESNNEPHKQQSSDPWAKWKKD